MAASAPDMTTRQMSRMASPRPAIRKASLLLDGPGPRPSGASTRTTSIEIRRTREDKVLNAAGSSSRHRHAGRICGHRNGEPGGRLGRFRPSRHSPERPSPSTPPSSIPRVSPTFGNTTRAAWLRRPWPSNGTATSSAFLELSTSTSRATARAGTDGGRGSFLPYCRAILRRRATGSSRRQTRGSGRRGGPAMERAGLV